MTTIKLLVIDDSIDVCRALSHRLQKVDGFQIVQTAVNGSAVLLSQSPPTADIAIIGLTRSSQANLTHTQQIIRGMVTKGIAVLVLSPFLDEAEGNMLQAAGASRYLLKTINTLELIQQIRAVAEKKSERRD